MADWAKLRNRKISGQIAVGSKRDWYFLGKKFDHYLAISEGKSFYVFELPMALTRFAIRKKRRENLPVGIYWEIDRIENAPMGFAEYYRKASKTGTYSGFGDFDIDATFTTTLFPGTYRLSSITTGVKIKTSRYFLERVK